MEAMVDWPGPGREGGRFALPSSLRTPGLDPVVGGMIASMMASLPSAGLAGWLVTRECH